jgi:hypothetical protein
MRERQLFFILHRVDYEENNDAMFLDAHARIIHREQCITEVRELKNGNRLTLITSQNRKKISP